MLSVSLLLAPAAAFNLATRFPKTPATCDARRSSNAVARLGFLQNGTECRDNAWVLLLPLPARARGEPGAEREVFSSPRPERGRVKITVS